MKKNATSHQKLKLSRETLRHLERHKLGQVVGGTSVITCPVELCLPSEAEGGGCTQSG